MFFFFFSSRRRHTRYWRDWSSDVCSSDLRNTFNVYSTYKLWLGAEKEHAFKFMLGMNQVTSKWKTYTGTKNDLIDQTNPQFKLASGEQFIDGDTDWEAQLGYFGRINYAYADRYLVEANLRRDGSSKIGR